MIKQLSDIKIDNEDDIILIINLILAKIIEEGNHIELDNSMIDNKIEICNLSVWFFILCIFLNDLAIDISVIKKVYSDNFVSPLENDLNR